MKQSLIPLLTLALCEWFLAAPHAGAQTPNPPFDDPSCALPTPCERDLRLCPDSWEISFQGFWYYQGLPADGLFDIITSIYHAPTGGTPIGPPTTNQGVRVQRGLFTIYVKVPVQLSCLPPPEGGDTWWIEHCVKHPEDPICQVIQPRQKITPTVQALYAKLADAVRDGAVTARKMATGAVASAALADGAVTATKLAPGAVGNIGLGDGSVTASKIADGAVLRSLNGMQDAVILSAGEGLLLTNHANNLALHVVRACDDYDDWYWTLFGNNNVVRDVNFLGTTINVPVDVRVNNHRAMRYEDTGADTSPNTTGGYVGNLVSGVGGTISGGGQLNGINKVLGDYGVVGGGERILIDVNSWYAVVGGGQGNSIRTNSSYSSIGGGSTNLIDSLSPWSAIGGGEINSILPGAHHAAVGGGKANIVEPGAYLSAIGGGIANRIGTNSYFSVIAGGQQSTIEPNSYWSFIGGGSLNNAKSDFAFIGAGRRNTVESQSGHAFIGGGGGNLITNAPHGTIGGGATNTATAPFTTVPGGTRAVASHYGQLANAAGRFANDGDAQTSVFVLRNTTSTNSPMAELFLDGVGQRMTLLNGATWTFDILVSARTASAVGGTSAGYHFNGVIKRVGADTTLVAPVIRQDFEEAAAAAWNVDIIADNLNDALVIRVTGNGPDTIRWDASVRTAELLFP